MHRFCCTAVALLVVGTSGIGNAAEAADAADRKAATAVAAAEDAGIRALRSLADRGLIYGYKDGRSLEWSTLTRVEVASLVIRAIRRLGEVRMELPVSEAPGTAAGRGQGREVPPSGRSAPSRAQYGPDDLTALRNLVHDYSAELRLVGSDPADALERVDALEKRTAELEKAVNDPKGPLQTALEKATRADRVRLGGYIQARYESFGKTREADPADSRVPVTDRFTLRRVRASIAARLSEKSAVRWQIDLSPNSVETRDAWLDYYFSGNPATGYTASIGQFKVPFGFEVVQSSGVREAPERARVIRYFYPSERDRGIRLSSPTGRRWFYEVALYNGVIGPGVPALNRNDNNNNKNLAGRVRTTQLGGRLDAGVSFDFGNSLRTALIGSETPRAGGPPSGENPYENSRITLGSDFQWHLGRTEVRGELLWGKAEGTYAYGYIAQVLRELGPRWQAVVKYDWLGIEDLVLAPVGAGGTPVGDAVPYEGTLSNLSLGIIHRLTPETRLKLFYEIHGHGREVLPYGPVPWQGNVLRFEAITNY